MKKFKHFSSKFVSAFIVLCLLSIYNIGNVHALNSYEVVIQNLEIDGEYTSYYDLIDNFGEIYYCIGQNTVWKSIGDHEPEKNISTYTTYKITSDSDTFTLKCKPKEGKFVQINNSISQLDIDGCAYKTLSSDSKTEIKFIDCNVYQITLNNQPKNSHYDQNYIDKYGEILYSIDSDSKWNQINQNDPIHGAISSYSANGELLSYMLNIQKTKSTKVKFIPIDGMQLYINGKSVALSEDSSYICTLNRDINVEFKKKENNPNHKPDYNPDHKTEEPKKEPSNNDTNVDSPQESSKNPNKSPSLDNIKHQTDSSNHNQQAENYDDEKISGNPNEYSLTTGDELEYKIYGLIILSILSLTTLYLIKNMKSKKKI